MSLISTMSLIMKFFYSIVGILHLIADGFIASKKKPELIPVHFSMRWEPVQVLPVIPTGKNSSNPMVVSTK